jgi:hypothetical protein
MDWTTARHKTFTSVQPSRNAPHVPESDPADVIGSRPIRP